MKSVANRGLSVVSTDNVFFGFLRAKPRLEPCVVLF